MRNGGHESLDQGWKTVGFGYLLLHTDSIQPSCCEKFTLVNIFEKWIGFTM